MSGWREGGGSHVVECCIRVLCEVSVLCQYPQGPETVVMTSSEETPCHSIMNIVTAAHLMQTTLFAFITDYMR